MTFVGEAFMTTLFAKLMKEHEVEFFESISIIIYEIKHLTKVRLKESLILVVP